MYFINTRKKLVSNTFLLHVLPAGTVLITVFGLTLLGWRNAHEAYKIELQTAINRAVNDMQGRVQDKLDSYELMLLGASGLFGSSDQVTRSEWKKFVSSFDIQQNYPGIQGIGYAVHARPEELPGLAQSVRREGFKDFDVFPAGSRPEYVVNLYYEPLNPTGLGFDMFSEPARRQAILTAKNTGTSSITGKLQFVRGPQQLGSTGFSMYLPVYTSGAQQALPPASRSAQGYVYAPFSADNFFTQALRHSTDSQYGLRIYDTSIEAKQSLFETTNFRTLDTSSSLNHAAPLSLFGRKWVLDFRFSPDIIAKTTRTRPTSSLIVGSMLSLLLSGFVWTLLAARTRVLSHTKQIEVQSAKDELLSLASHQLRTPATSVKQYIGMALEGFAGKLSSQQRNLLDKAYESNERQLHIINEILYVAKIDAKGIVLTPRRINLNKLLRELTQELSATAKKNRQKVRLQMPLRQTYVEADEHCLRMALENLISNALKYSYEGSTVALKLATTAADGIRITVKDKGVGIDPDDLPLLFQRFSRIPNELSRQTSGSGIGLYLSQQLVELHGGTIAVESIKGSGTTFTVSLPKIYKPKGNS
jgi:two-component system OmpR family sensor kinase